MSDDPRPREMPQSRDDEYLRLFEDSRDAIYFGSLDGHLLDINPAGVRLFEYASKEEMLSLNSAADLYWIPEDRKRIQSDVLDRGLVEDLEIEFKTQSGKRIRAQETASLVYDNEGRPSGTRSILHDITEQRRLEEQLCQSQKMEAVGRLAEGVAHDFNNLLTAINGYSELILVQIPEDDPSRAGISEIRRAGKRAAELTRRLLTLSRHQVGSLRKLHLNKVILEMEKLLRRVIGEDVEVETSLARDLPAIQADQSQIEQIILNLAINARDAMPSGGRLTIETATVKRPMHQNGTMVEVIVSDSGDGIASDVRERVFEPFFTTRVHRKRTGLGLTTVYRSIQRCGGHVEVTSEKGAGSTFRLFFPPEGLSSDSEEDFEHLETALPRGDETILLVEDETTVRDLVRRILETQGYRVLPAQDASTALDICSRLNDQLDLLLTDVVMPQTSGPALAEHLQLLYADLKVLFMSGYTDRHTGVRLFNQRSDAFLPKPFSPALLARKVREVLDEAPT